MELDSWLNLLDGFDEISGQNEFEPHHSEIAHTALDDYDYDLSDFSIIETFSRYTPSFSTEDNIAGDPEADGYWWNYQGAENSCAVVAQQGVLESILQRDLSRDELIELAEAKGWYDPEIGTMLNDVGNILEEFDIPVERGDGYEFSDLYRALTNGEKVIVGVNANELWSPIENPDGTTVQQDPAGHAVWVTGLVARDGDVYVVMNDSGPMSGSNEEIELKDFLNAWEDYGNFAVMTKING
jgi:hypothetical protein